jgi:lipoyl(octanoyl) transferase
VNGDVKSADCFSISLQNKPITLDKQLVTYKDLGLIDYKTAWDYQENLLQENVQLKSVWAKAKKSNHGYIPAAEWNALESIVATTGNDELPAVVDTRHYFLLCEHPPVYTIGKSGHEKNILISETEMSARGIQFFRTNRGGDITFHGPQQLVGYPILDLEKFYTDIGRYLRTLEEIIMMTLADYGVKGERSKGETGVWIDPGVAGKERKICAMGVRCSRWVTMHGFALNVNTDLGYFDNIIPCGIENKTVTSLEKELGHPVDMNLLKEKLLVNFSRVFNVEFRN